jgi:hypothetical protein
MRDVTGWMHMPNAEACWVSHPNEWQSLFREWNSTRPDTTEIAVWDQFGGEQLVALTALATGDEPDVRLLVAVPHAHEPAPTAACVNVASQLLRGEYLDGTPTSLPVDAIRERALVTFLPDSNPQGRSRSPERCWDGTSADNETFWKHAFGIASDGARFGRYPEWRLSAHHPRRVGLVYERLDADTFVEPNTSRLSSHARATDALFERHRYTHYLDMHQHEWEEATFLPSDFDEREWSDQDALTKWASAVVAAWRNAGSNPRLKPTIPYRGQPRQQFFRDFWRGRCPGMLALTTEVRNNRYDPTGQPTPLEYQFRMASAALESTLCHFLRLEP